MQQEKLLTVRMVAKRLGLSISTIYRLVEAGELEVIRTGLKKGYKVPETSLNEFVENRRQEVF